MKYAIQPPVLTQSEKEYQMDFTNLSLLLPDYELIDDQQKLKWTFNPRIFMCQFDSEPYEMNPGNCNIFKRVFTNDGIGYAFNHRDLNQGFQNSRGNQMYQHVIIPSNLEIGNVKSV